MKSPWGCTVTSPDMTLDVARTESNNKQDNPPLVMAKDRPESVKYQFRMLLL